MADYKKPNMSKNDLVKGAFGIAEWLVNAVKSVLIIAGVMCASIADVAFGTITLNQLLSNLHGIVIMGMDISRQMPFIISIAASGIQIIMWQIIEDKRGITSIYKSKNLGIWLGVIGVVILFLADTYTDVTALLYMTYGNTLVTMIDPDIYMWLLYAVVAIGTFLAGFSEVFMVLAFEYFREGSDKKENKHQQPQPQVQRPSHQVQPSRQLSTETMQQLIRNAKG